MKSCGIMREEQSVTMTVTITMCNDSAKEGASWR